MPDNLPSPNVSDPGKKELREEKELPETKELREETLQEILRRIEHKLREELSEELSIGGQTLDQIEEQSQKIREEVKRIIEEESLHSEGTGYSGAKLLCPQGHCSRYAGLRSRLMITRSGTRILRRAYYSCAVCRHGWCPRDKALGLGKGQCSRRVQALIARFSSYLPDRVAAQEMEAIYGVRLSTSTVQTYSRKIGQRIAKEWEQWQGVREPEDLPPSSVPCAPRRLHITMDGVMVHVEGAWHEAKLGCVYQTSAKGVAVKSCKDTLQRDVSQLRRVWQACSGSGASLWGGSVSRFGGRGRRCGLDLAGDGQVFPAQCAGAGLLSCDPVSLGLRSSVFWGKKSDWGRQFGRCGLDDIAEDPSAFG
jgi:hypothetical protein